MRQITTRAELVALARELGVRSDWHEPDEQELGAFVEGTSFDNAGTWPTSAVPHLEHSGAVELHVVLHKMIWDEEYSTWRRGQAIAAINLATLFAWATGYDERPSRSELDALDNLEREQNDVINSVVRRYFTMSDPVDFEMANSIIGELKDQLPRARPADVVDDEQRLLTERLSTLNRWASKFAEQHSTAPVGPQRIMAMALSDAFRQAAKHEQALHASRQRHPSRSIEEHRAGIPEYGTHD